MKEYEIYFPIFNYSVVIKEYLSYKKKKFQKSKNPIFNLRERRDSTQKQIEQSLQILMNKK